MYFYIDIKAKSGIIKQTNVKKIPPSFMVKKRLTKLETENLIFSLVNEENISPEKAPTELRKKTNLRKSMEEIIEILRKKKKVFSYQDQKWIDISVEKVPQIPIPKEVKKIQEVVVPNPELVLIFKEIQKILIDIKEIGEKLVEKRIETVVQERPVVPVKDFETDLKRILQKYDFTTNTMKDDFLTIRISRSLKMFFNKERIKYNVNQTKLLEILIIKFIEEEMGREFFDEL